MSRSFDHPVKPEEGRGAVTRRRLLAAATEELVDRDGQLEVDSVAFRAGVSVGSIYRHFGSRAGLVGAVVDDFYKRYRTEALETNPVPGGRFAERERKRTELSVRFHYQDPLAVVILWQLHLDPEVAANEGRHIDEMIAEATAVMALGQKRGELPKDRDPQFVGAMIIGGMRRVLGVALTSDPPISEHTTARKLWVLNASIMGLYVNG